MILYSSALSVVFKVCCIIDQGSVFILLQVWRSAVRIHIIVWPSQVSSLSPIKSVLYIIFLVTHFWIYSSFHHNLTISLKWSGSGHFQFWLFLVIELFNNSLNLFIDDIINNPFNNSAIFGPRTNRAAIGHPNGLPAENKPYTYLDVDYGVHKNLLYGFCFGFTRNSYRLGKHTSNEFFPYEIESIHEATLGVMSLRRDQGHRHWLVRRRRPTHSKQRSNI